MQARGPQRSALLAAAWGLLERELETLRIDCGAHAAYLLNSAGQMLLEAGATRSIQPSVLGMLVAGGLATTLEIASLLNEPEVASLHYYHGKEHEVYASALDREHQLCLIVATATQHSRVGVVWLAIKRSGRRIRELLALLDRAEHEDPRVPTRELQRAILHVWSERASQADDSEAPARPLAPEQVAPFVDQPGQGSARGTDSPLPEEQAQTDWGGPLRSYREALELGLLGDEHGRGAKEGPADG